MVSDHFFYFIDIYKIKTMIFLASLSIDSIRADRAISAGTWSQCVTYCESISTDISGIQLLSDPILVLNHPESENSYFVGALSKTSGMWYNYIVWETDFDALYTWIQSQSSLNIQSISERNLAYVAL